ncbi:hypothetical protein B0T17DRAFT_636395 [Bombardia bombarda]|uniref:Uncharacterized protein n=1 Tax=Bombardia bombarda TaxID=252184 RepID=A0AA39XBU7_9PEZI|nr:hypothetical protein B0T17DRAFT_636395 [Bombardia bombarda]
MPALGEEASPHSHQEPHTQESLRRHNQAHSPSSPATPHQQPPRPRLLPSSSEDMAGTPSRQSSSSSPSRRVNPPPVTMDGNDLVVTGLDGEGQGPRDQTVGRGAAAQSDGAEHGDTSHVSGTKKASKEGSVVVGRSWPDAMVECATLWAPHSGCVSFLVHCVGVSIVGLVVGVVIVLIVKIFKTGYIINLDCGAAWRAQL